MKKVLEKTMSIILNILLILVILILILVVYNYFQIYILENDYTNFFGYTIFKVSTGSMADTINIGDVIIAKVKQDDTEFENEDIIVFKQDNQIITHRIVDIDEKKIVTKGDANNTVDEPITKEDIIGTIVKVIPNVGIWRNVFSSPKVLISGTITIILFSVAFSYDRRKKEDK